MNLANMNVQIRSVSQQKMDDYWNKWVGQKVKKKPYMRDENEYTVVHAQMLMGEDLKLDNGEWVSPWQLVGH